MRKPTLEDTLEYVGVAGFVEIMRRLPLRVSLALGAGLGCVAFDLLRFRRRVTLSNLRMHLDRPGVCGSPTRIGRKSYANFGMGIVEFSKLPLVTTDYIDRNIRVDGLEHLDEAVHGGRGAVLVTGHFGSWELMGCVLRLLNYPVDFVVGIQRNPLVQMLMNNLRLASGIDVIELTSILSVVRSLKAGRFTAMLCDQDAGRGGVFVDFLGGPASTPKGAARLAIMAGVPIIPGFIIRIGGAKHRIVIEKPIYGDETKDVRTSVSTLTQAYTRVIEAYVRRYPDHWLWAHRRWKTKPS